MNSPSSEMKHSPTSSMSSSFEPTSISPRSRGSTGNGVSSFLSHSNALSSFAPTVPPKKPPRRNLSVSPTHHGQINAGNRMTMTRSPSNNSPSYSQQSHSSAGTMSCDENQLNNNPTHFNSQLIREMSQKSEGLSSTSSSSKLK